MLPQALTVTKLLHQTYYEFPTGETNRKIDFATYNNFSILRGRQICKYATITKRAVTLHQLQ